MRIGTIRDVDRLLQCKRPPANAMPGVDAELLRGLLRNRSRRPMYRCAVKALRVTQAPMPVQRLPTHTRRSFREFRPNPPPYESKLDLRLAGHHRKRPEAAHPSCAASRCTSLDEIRPSR